MARSEPDLSIFQCQGGYSASISMVTLSLPSSFGSLPRNLASLGSIFPAFSYRRSLNEIFHIRHPSLLLNFVVFEILQFLAPSTGWSDLSARFTFWWSYRYL